MANEAVSQTNRTAVVEVINPEKLNILTLIGDTKSADSLTDDKIREINSHLECASFDEFLEKFQPVVYSFFNANNQRVMYVLEKPENIPDNMITEIPLNKHQDFLKMLMTMVETKQSQGILNVDFKFETLLELMSPKKVMEDIKQSRREIRYVYQQYTELDDEDPKKRDLGDKLNVMFEEASQNYSNVLAMLPLAIEDIKTRLLLGQSSTGGDNTPLALGVLSMGEDGELKVLEAPKEETTALATVDDNVNTGLMEAFRDDYRAVAETESQNSYVESLVVRTFCPLPSTMVSNVDVEKEVSNYNSYLQFYKTSKDDFVKVVKPLAQKILGIKLFFDQYPRKLRGGMQPKLLYMNISPEMLSKSSNITSIITYLNTVNGKNDYTHTIWQAIVPEIALNTKQQVKLTRERFKGNDVVVNTDVNTMESLTRLLDVFKDYRIQTFFGFEGNETTTFNQLAVEGGDKYMNRCQPLIGKPYSEFAIPCYPNFTIVPKDKSGVVLDSRMILNEQNGAEISREREDLMKLWVEGVYVNGSYVGAGITAAYQCPVFLKHIFRKKVDSSLPGVRFDIEEGDNNLRVRTTMAKEITGFTTSIKDQINRRGFGFVFSSENASYGSEAISHIMVYKARSLMMGPDDTFEPIYRTLTTTYIMRVMRHATSDYKADKIKEFFSNNPASQKSLWFEKKEYVNGVVHTGDELNVELDEASGVCRLDMGFGGAAKNMEIETNRYSTSASA